MKVILLKKYPFTFSDEAENYCREKGITGARFMGRLSSSKRIRTDSILIEAIEKFEEKNFKIVDIPFNSFEGWDIDDTYEYIYEHHRTWS